VFSTIAKILGNKDKYLFWKERTRKEARNSVELGIFMFREHPPPLPKKKGKLRKEDKWGYRNEDK